MYTVPSVTVVVVSVTVDDSILPDNVIARIFDNLVGNSDATAITAFQPECKLCTNSMCIQIHTVLPTYLKWCILLCVPHASTLLQRQVAWSI